MTTQQLAVMTLTQLDARYAELEQLRESRGGYSTRERARLQQVDVVGEIDRRLAQERT